MSRSRIYPGLMFALAAEACIPPGQGGGIMLSSPSQPLTSTPELTPDASAARDRMEVACESPDPCDAVDIADPGVEERPVPSLTPFLPRTGENNTSAPFVKGFALDEADDVTLRVPRGAAEVEVSLLDVVNNDNHFLLLDDKTLILLSQLLCISVDAAMYRPRHHLSNPTPPVDRLIMVRKLFESSPVLQALKNELARAAIAAGADIPEDFFSRPITPSSLKGGTGGGSASPLVPSSIARSITAKPADPAAA
jgi:hypothetical protein